MKKITNLILNGKHQKPILLDVFYKENNSPKSIIIFCHGYKGFKDWGAWNLMAESFAKNDFFFLKFNFSHNGGTAEQPIDFPDLKAFGNNNYTKELDDLETVLDWIYENSEYQNEINTNNISLIGHSRGGGIVCIKSEEDMRIKNVITLAGVSDYKSRFPKNDDFIKWKEKGVYYVKNGRTHQEMPHFYQFYEDFYKNENRLTIKRAVKNLQIPHLIIHGDNDTSVLVDEAKTQHQWNPESQLEIIENANHVFGAKHPWEENILPEELKKTLELCFKFLKT
ncbi:S9 family peptidase [Lutibacter sp. Hel_I_33_5]|uniref:alpha/beta hydrolase family protein n=1 Tax=Lutibacter sp. Hel_I_33_5 TaxID=1566289 RepID=UPI00119D1D70|nr:alpha/beta hydrolase [Lutibacter sp. Hel_I_33_5]